MLNTPLQMILVALAGWVNEHQLAVIEYLKQENRVLREQVGRRRLRFTDDQRRRLAAKGQALGRRVLRERGTIVTPDTIHRWYRRLVAREYDGSRKRRPERSKRMPWSTFLRAHGEAIADYVEHCHRERTHQGLGDRLIEGVPEREAGRVVRRNRLGGILSHYYREAA